jgi:hypothetical protein
MQEEEENMPTCEKIQNCMQETKKNKAPGEDGIMAELIKYGRGGKIDAIHN